MSKRILIVEDEILVALELEELLAEHGHQPVGIAPDTDTALRLADSRPEVALVDLNLRDGQTGGRIGEMLARDHGIKVVFTSANPALLAEGVTGTVGILPKPYEFQDILSAIEFVANASTLPPRGLRLFGSGAPAA